MSSHPLPSYDGLPIQKLAQVFNNTSATYKFYWFLAILDCVEAGKREIAKTDLFAKMLAHPWYTVNFFKLSFGSQDLIQDSIKALQELESLEITLGKREIEYKLKESNKKETKKKLFHFNKNVPHWFLSPWYKGKKRTEIYSLSSDFDGIPPYALFDKKIIIEEKWYDYFQLHAKLLKEFSYWNLALFLQAKNPNVPDIPNKLIKPAKRKSLTKQRKEYWNLYLKAKDEVRCIFTNKILDPANYELDHFIPYAFVSHDLIWNLVPIDPGFNSQKSHKLPQLDMHYDKFFALQKDAFTLLMHNKGLKKYWEEFHTVFPVLKTPSDFKFEKLRNSISPLITTAHNNGFEFLNYEKSE